MIDGRTHISMTDTLSKNLYIFSNFLVDTNTLENDFIECIP